MHGVYPFHALARIPSPEALISQAAVAQSQWKQRLCWSIRAGAQADTLTKRDKQDSYQAATLITKCFQSPVSTQARGWEYQLSYL